MFKLALGAYQVNLYGKGSICCIRKLVCFPAIIPSLFFILMFFCGLNAKAQKKNDKPLSRKYAAFQLREDAQLMKEVIMKMHPAIGIYQPRNYYDKLFDDFIASLSDSLTERQFRIKTKIILDELHCGHTEALSSEAYMKAVNKMKPGYSPYVFIPLQEKVFVFASLNRKRDTLLKKGDVITRINGVSTDSMLRLCRKLITTDGYNVTGKDHYLKLGFNSYYPALFGRPDTFDVEVLKGEKLARVRYPALHVNSMPSIPLLAKDDSTYRIFKRAKIKYKQLDGEGKSALVKVHSFSKSGYRKAYRKIFKSLEKQKTENLVLDLRYNGGGSLENSYTLLSYLIDSARTQTLRTGIKNYPQRRYTHGNIMFKLMRFGFGIIAHKERKQDTASYVYRIKPRKNHHFNGKVYVLINGGSFSASCLVGAYLKEHQRASFIGEETSGALEGCNAGITPYYKLPNTKIKIRVPAFRIMHDVNSGITGRGIMPDYKVEYSIKDVLGRRDLELEKAKELIK
jgi:hypothetical protein